MVFVRDWRSNDLGAGRNTAVTNTELAQVGRNGIDAGSDSKVSTSLNFFDENLLP